MRATLPARWSCSRKRSPRASGSATPAAPGSPGGWSAWALRNLGRRDEALALQLALKAELEAIGEDDPYVDEEVTHLTAPEPPPTES